MRRRSYVFTTLNGHWSTRHQFQPVRCSLNSHFRVSFVAGFDRAPIKPCAIKMSKWQNDAKLRKRIAHGKWRCIPNHQYMTLAPAMKIIIIKDLANKCRNKHTSPFWIFLITRSRKEAFARSSLVVWWIIVNRMDWQFLNKCLLSHGKSKYLRNAMDRLLKVLDTKSNRKVNNFFHVWIHRSIQGAPRDK